MVLSFMQTSAQLKAKQGPPSLRKLLHDHLSGFDPIRPLKTIHASELTRPEGFCPRYYALADVRKHKPKDRWKDTSLEVTFEIGRMMQDRVVNWFADMGKAICHWKCLGCGHLHQFQLRPVKCVTCGIKAFKPEEVRFVSAKSGASAGVDMLLAMGKQKLTHVEIKTMAPDEFKGLKAPLAEHRLRTNLYSRIIAEDEAPWSSLVDDTEGLILYCSKGGFGCADPTLEQQGVNEKFSPFKEWRIPRDDEETDTITLKSASVKHFREKLKGMPCGICTTALVERAKKCDQKVACFSGDFPPKAQP